MHTTRGWDPPAFDGPVVQLAIQALQRVPVVVPSEPSVPRVFTQNEIKRIFAANTSLLSYTQARDAAIMAIQLFGARRASEVLNLTMSDVVMIDDHFRFRIRRSKTDQRGMGLFFRLPHDTALGINPTRIFQAYIKSRQPMAVSEEAYIFTTFNAFGKKYMTTPLTVKSYNKRLTVIQRRAGVTPRTSHAFRATAVSLSNMEDVHTVAQVGGWRSMTYLTTYHITPITEQSRALANIGSRILMKHQDQEIRDDQDDE